jgi:hypothetical protein
VHNQCISDACDVRCWSFAQSGGYASAKADCGAGAHLAKNKGGDMDKARQIGFYHMLRDVLVASLNKGQFLIALNGLILIVLILKMPSADVGRLVFRLLDVTEAHYLLGYILAVVSLLGWFSHSKYQRRMITQELGRLSGERNRLQAQALGNRIKSSEESK